MKVYSNTAITKTDLDVIDEKQNSQIRKLRLQVFGLACVTILIAVIEIASVFLK